MEFGDIMKIDIYELLNISVTADEKEIKSAYRKKALSCHPDKNPDNPQAALLFQQLSKALEILTDVKARAAYDQVLRAKKAAVLRHRELDSKRKKLKEDLEAKERAAQDERINHIDAKRRLQKEIERLRKEGSKQLEQEKELLRQKLIEEANKKVTVVEDTSENLPRLKVKWKIPKGESDTSVYTHDELKSILEKYGQITCLAISAKKPGTAIVEFSTVDAAKSAIEGETGRQENPLKLSWISGQPKAKDNNQQTVDSDESTKNNCSVPEGPMHPFSESTTLTPRDYESIVLMKLRQAEERKKLIQQIMEEEKQ